MARRILVLLNAKAGTGDDHSPQAVAEALREAGLDPIVECVPGPRLAEAARAALGRDVEAVVAAGGDGTVSAVASALAGSSMPMGVLPLGTLNHFAKDLGLPIDLREAARALAEGTPRTVDVGEANGRVFVNNASVGFYPLMVMDRDAQRRRSGRPKWLAAGIAAVRVLWRFPLMWVRVRLVDRVLPRRTPFVFVGNNRYGSRLADARRERLDGGELCVYTAHPRGRWDFLRLVWRAARGKAEEVPGLDLATGPHVHLETAQRVLRVALDGEVHRMHGPLRLRVRPGALRVLAPGGGA